MKIRSVFSTLIPLTLHEPYTIAYQTIDTVSNVYLRIEGDFGFCLSACGPDEGITLETPESVQEIITSTIAPLLIGEDIESRSVRETALALLEKTPAARALLEFAFHDYDSRSRLIPLWQYLGGSPAPMPTAITINIHSVPETIRRVLKWKDKGFFIYKVKGGLNVAEDIERLHAVRHAIGGNVSIIFDANQGYSYQESLHFIKETRTLHINVIEQPTSKHAPELLSEIFQATDAPLMMDESIISYEDAVKIFSKYPTPFLNIKIMKCGGIDRARAIAALALEKGAQCLLGCMDECALSNAFSLHCASALGNVPFVDLDSFTDYVDDPTHGAFSCINGFLTLSDRPGVGIEEIA